MKHLKEEKKKKTLSRGAKIAICVVAGVLAAVGVCTALWLTNRVTGYREAKNYTSEILSTKAAVEEFLDAKVGEEGISEENKMTFTDYSDAVKKSSDYLESLGATGVLKNETVNEKYETAKKELEKLVRVKDVESKLMEILEDGEISEEELTTLKDLKSDYLTKMAEDLAEYRAKVAEFNEKYADLKGVKKTDLDNDYAALVAAGDELKKKYAEIKMDDVLGMSRDDILRFYGTIEELDNYLAEKI
ncbi:MAG: hypothetical protein Q4D22_00660 [Candidatus Saccharibacteria bacterium]|nr:hypothetical protein [Candidatus Saccharibacteria bacterium]